MIDWLALALLPLVTYRLTRLWLLDSLLETSRDRLFLWFDTRRRLVSERQSRRFWRTLAPARARETFWLKLHDGASCSFCISVWIAAFALVYWCAFTGEWFGWAWPIVWLSIATAAMAVYRYIDPPE